MLLVSTSVKVQKNGKISNKGKGHILPVVRANMCVDRVGSWSWEVSLDHEALRSSGTSNSLPPTSN